MRKAIWPAAVVALALFTMQPAAAQRVLDIGGPPGAAAPVHCYTDSMLTAVLAAFNDPAAVRVFMGQSNVGAQRVIEGDYHVFRGQVRIDGTVHGNVIVLDGGLRISATGTVSGTVTVLGGPLVVDPGAHVGGAQSSCEESVALALSDNIVIVAHQSAMRLRNLASEFAWMVNGFRVTPHLGVGQYNRVEALPIDIGATVMRGIIPGDTGRFDGYAVLRTGRDPSGSRPPVGWHATALLSHSGAIPYTIGAEGGATVDATVDSPLTSAESGLSAFVLRRDYSDWLYRRGGSLFGTINPVHEVTVGASWEKSHETTTNVTDAFSILRGSEAWRVNPPIDDGTYQLLSGFVTWDARNSSEHPTFSWYLHGDLHHVTADSLSPVILPTSIRNALPTDHYGETDGNFDARGYLRLNPLQRISARISGGGYASGDPLTIQRRRALGGSDPMPGYDFRGINCDRRRRIDPATPALCDRVIAAQVEYRHVLPVEVGTRVGGYNIGIRRPDFVIFADAGSAWLAGDSAGRVPSGKIQDIAEWKSDFGVGLASGPIGIYVSRSLVDALPVRFVALLSVRF